MEATTSIAENATPSPSVPPARPKTDPISDLKYWCKGEPSEVGCRVAKLLADWVGGSHHLDQAEMKQVDWQNQHFIEIKATSVTTGGSLSSFDFDMLTRLVFLAHDRCIRVDVGPLGRRVLRIMFHPRNHREGGMSERHPTIEQAIERWRQTYISEQW